jgi:hypothetical protein
MAKVSETNPYLRSEEMRIRAATEAVSRSSVAEGIEIPAAELEANLRQRLQAKPRPYLGSNSGSSCPVP